MSLQDVMQRADIWRGGRAPAALGIPSGFPELDRLLVGGGWPQGALTEILVPRTGSGELRLLLPALAHLSRREQWLVFVAPPYIPYAPALARAGVNLSHVLLIHPPHKDVQVSRETGCRERPSDTHNMLWALEQTLRAGAASAVLAWPKVIDAKALRRLQLAAEAGGALGMLFRPERAVAEHSPAALRLRLAPHPEGVEVSVLKRRGGWPAGPINVVFPDVMAGAAPSRSSARGLHAR